MPIETMVADANRAWAIWRITESENDIISLLSGMEDAPQSVSHPQKRMEYLTGRLVMIRLMKALNLTYQGMIKDQHGKPFLKGHSHHISLSHSYPYVAAIIDADRPVGIDLEQPKEKLLRIGPRVLSNEELANAGQNVVKHCIYWCAKETMIKIHGKKGLQLASELLVSSFELAQEGNIVGRLLVDGKVTVLPLYYIVTREFTLVFNTGS
jgi:4'-phosphopantetheinyl transferase